MTILYTSANPNLSTVRLVASAIREQLRRDQLSAVKKVVLFASTQARKEKVFHDQLDAYDALLGPAIRTEVVLLNAQGVGEVQDYAGVFREPGEKLIDLTNGQRTTASQLYLAGSLLKIPRIYYASLRTNPQQLPEEPVFGQDYDYVPVLPFSDIARLSKLSYFDLVFYLEEVDRLFADVAIAGTFLKNTDRDFRKAIGTFFAEDSYRSAVSDVTTFVEVMIIAIVEFLRGYGRAQAIAQQYGVVFTDPKKDPVGVIATFFRRYADTTNPRIAPQRDPNLEPLLTIPGLLSALRSFRNLGAHSGAYSRDFQAGEARICINLALECMSCAKGSGPLWASLMARK